LGGSEITGRKIHFGKIRLDKLGTLGYIGFVASDCFERGTWYRPEGKKGKKVREQKPDTGSCQPQVLARVV